MKFNKIFFMRIISALFLWFIFSQTANAVVIIHGTRIIFAGNTDEVQVKTDNKGQIPMLAQVWVDDGSGEKDINKIKVPFGARPPIYRIDPGHGQSVVLKYNGMTLPQDRESVFWFNLLETAPVNEADANKYSLELAFRTRIKIFYRPAALLKSNGIKEIKLLRWENIGGNKLKVTNGSPYYISFNSATATEKGRGAKGNLMENKFEIDTDMVAPFSSKVFTIKTKTKKIVSVSRIDFQLLSDYGTIVERHVVNTQGKGFTMAN